MGGPDFFFFLLPRLFPPPIRRVPREGDQSLGSLDRDGVNETIVATIGSPQLLPAPFLSLVCCRGERKNVLFPRAHGAAYLMASRERRLAAERKTFDIYLL